MPSHSLENPFNKKDLDPDDAAFVKSVLGKGASKSKISKKEDFGSEIDDLVLSAEDHEKIKDERISDEIILRERQALREFFGKEILVPPPPKQATRERILEWRQLGLELHYLPPISMAEIRRGPEGEILEVIPIEFPGWKKKPGRQYTRNQEYGIDLFDKVKSGALDPSVFNLPGAWVLFDSCEKPNYGGEYANDPLAQALEELRKKKIVENFEVKGSRFHLSPQELENPKVLTAFAKVLNLDAIPGLIIDIPRVIEFNLLGNIYYPQWGTTSAYEWFSDKCQYGGQRFYGGRSFVGGLSYILSVSPKDRGDRSVDIGFRLIARFPSNQERVDKK
ncbi:MAG TPA: hypothetical protein VFQ60_00015 [Patescibacteria group bacterium]|nr:hypothetical protein [Patescibacteria group bacterium]